VTRVAEVVYVTSWVKTIGATTMGTGGTGPPNFWDPGTSNVLVPQLFGLTHFFPSIFFLCIRVKK
jgi:hypothetical protein